MMKGGIYTSPAWTASVGSSGINLTKRIYLYQKVHNGPKDTLDRDVNLILEPHEALELATALLGQLSPEEIGALDDKFRKLLESYLRLASHESIVKS